MSLPKGRTNNPAGRPSKSRALTEILVRSLSKTTERAGKRVSRKRVLADLVTEAVTEGKVTMIDGTILELGPKDWAEFAKWTYQHIDGSVSHNEHTGEGGGPVVIKVKRNRAGDDADE